MREWLRKIIRSLKCKCPKCKTGRLTNNDVTGIGFNTNIYECDVCGNRFV